MLTRRTFLQSALLLPVALTHPARADQTTSATVPTGIPAQPKPATEVFADFEGGNYDGWTLEGNAFGSAPATDALFPGQISGFTGRGFLCSLHPKRGNVATGKATSREFTIEKPFIDFKIGGGNHPGEACLNLVVDNQIVRTATGNDTPVLVDASWDVSALVGKKAHMEAVDSITSSERGYILVDDIQFVNPFSEQSKVLHDAGLDNYLNTWSDREGIPAAYLAVATRRKFYGSVSGVLKRNVAAGATIENHFRIGSVTKPMTSTLIMLLVNDGILDLSAHPSRYLPALIKNMDIGYSGITLRHLLTHTAGLPGPGTGRSFSQILGETPEQYAIRERYTVVTEDYFKYPPTQAIGTYTYSNNGYTILGAVAEAATKIAYEQLMVERVFHPLSMTQSGIGLPGKKGILSEPWYYPMKDGHEGQPFEPVIENDQSPLAMPQGGVFTTIADSCRFIEAHMRWFACGYEAGLKRDVSREMFATPYTKDRNLAWQTWQEGRFGIALTHSGQNSDYRGPWQGSNMRVIPGVETGILLVTTNGIEMGKLHNAVNEIQHYILGSA